MKHARIGLVLLGLLPAACGPRGPTTSAFDGNYKGTGYAADQALAGVACNNNIPITMKVTGGHVEFSEIRGWVQPNGKLETVWGELYMYGQFQGTHFEGTHCEPATWVQVSVVYG